MGRGYTEKELVCVAKREKNNKRKYLVVNRLQGKHVPVDPGSCLEMFDALAEIVAGEYAKEKMLLIGFAETATAVGERMAIDMDCPYMQTTRESIEGVEYLYFTEAHSHATEQKLVRTDLDKVIDETERIVFVEDEVTTGNTILGIVELIWKEYGRKVAFSVASVLNGMDKDAEARYAAMGIALHYLVKTDHSCYEETAEGCKGDGSYYGFPEEVSPFRCYDAGGYINARRLHNGRDYEAACKSLYSRLNRWFCFRDRESVLVLGTEEFMYPAIYVAFRLEERGCLVKCHSTTRSPIAVGTEDGYPLHERYELHSLYEEERRTFIYDLGKYDKVFILTDAAGGSGRGISDLCKALEACGNKDIYVVRWGG